MEMFNLALLARQSWRMLQNPLSLSARILKSIYYPDSDIFGASLGSHPSQIWRAILDGRDIMVQGLVRRIGDGTSTKIWEDNWLPRSHARRPMACLVDDPPRSVFIPLDAKAILQIPLCTRQVDDFWAWAKERKGVFSVRSAYRMIQRTKLSREAWLYEQGGSSDSHVAEQGWTDVWRSRVPSTLKFFLWR